MNEVIEWSTGVQLSWPNWVTGGPLCGYGFCPNAVGVHVDAEGREKPESTGRIGLRVPTTSGVVLAVEGDWIMHHPARGFYVLSAAEYAARYNERGAVRKPSDSDAPPAGTASASMTDAIAELLPPEPDAAPPAKPASDVAQLARDAVAAWRDVKLHGSDPEPGRWPECDALAEALDRLDLWERT